MKIQILDQAEQDLIDWIDHLVEDKLEFTPESGAEIQASESEMSAGTKLARRMWRFA